MICIFFIGGSHFTKNIKYTPKWITKLDEKYLIKNNNYLDYEILIKRYKDFYDNCSKKYKIFKIGIFGICSGGYYALKIKKKIKMDFCICISPVINPQFRLKYLIKQIENNSYPEKNSYFKNIINTPQPQRKIYNTIDDSTLIIVGKKDIQCPLEMYFNYKITNFIILDKEDHSITSHPKKFILLIISDFLNKI